MASLSRICVYCGSSPGLLPEYVNAAKQLGAFLAARKIDLIYGGSNVGLMGVLAESALAGGGNVIGVIPESLNRRVGHPALTELHVVPTMHERKQRMFDLADGFIGMPGGIGTIEELFEVFTWAQLGFHNKPCGLLNISGFFNKLLGFLDYSVEQRFVKFEHRNMLLVSNSPEDLVAKLESYVPYKNDKWLDQE